MSFGTGSKGDRGKAPIHAATHRDSSSDDETTSAGKKVARVMQSHFDRGVYDTKPVGGIPMETQSRRRHSIEMASVSSESHTISNGVSS